MDMILLIIGGMLGTPEIILIVVAIVILFGARKIPELMKGLGRGVKEFKEGIKDEEKEDKENSK